MAGLLTRGLTYHHKLTPDRQSVHRSCRSRRVNAEAEHWLHVAVNGPFLGLVR